MAKATGRTEGQIKKSLWHLRICRCVDVVINPDGTSWWFALDECEDTRHRVIEERVIESKPRKTSRRKRT